jgi:hypothetical protein
MKGNAQVKRVGLFVHPGRSEGTLSADEWRLKNGRLEGAFPNSKLAKAAKGQWKQS